MNYETELKTTFYFKNICVKARKKIKQNLTWL